MKKVYFLFISVLLLFSCSQPDISQADDAEVKFADQKWELVRMSGKRVNSTKIGSDMEWQEHYLFSLDGTFQKTRSNGDIISKATGIFEVVEYDNDEADYLELTYQEGFGLIGNCSGDQTEILIYQSNTEIANTWMACNGPGLDYILVQD
ncbi:hypothetical protein [Maribacter antarcticus]|uniref:hypothetical protein n=1 Tax=Maribacter antarcticus TaxID=505250 RepID=UPI0006890FA2|nr:hypothetical protein [Maribacter antarcticus]